MLSIPELTAALEFGGFSVTSVDEQEWHSKIAYLHYLIVESNGDRAMDSMRYDKLKALGAISHYALMDSSGKPYQGTLMDAAIDELINGDSIPAVHGSKS